MQMSLGEKAMLRITSDYGYGARGAGGVIPPNADLNFEVELLAINGKSESLSNNVVYIDVVMSIVWGRRLYARMMDAMLLPLLYLVFSTLYHVG